MNPLLFGMTFFGLQLHFPSQLDVHDICFMGFLLVQVYWIPFLLIFNFMCDLESTTFPQIPATSDAGREETEKEKRDLCFLHLPPQSIVISSSEHYGYISGLQLCDVGY